VLTAILLKIQVFWDVMPCRLVITDVLKECNAVVFKVKQFKVLSSFEMSVPSYLPVDRV
jgi:hypothetical protein